MLPNKRLNDQWCRDHWRPYRKTNAEGVRPNGIAAALLLMQAFIDSPTVTELTDRSAKAMNALMESSQKPLCCRLGDEVMARILAEATAAGVRDDA